MRFIGTFVAFQAAFWVAFSFESWLAFTPVAAVAICAGLLARSHSFILVSSVLGTVAYFATLQLFGQLFGGVPADSVEGFAQVFVNAAAILIVLFGITSAARLARHGLRKWRAAQQAAEADGRTR